MTYAIIGFTVLISLLALRDRKVFESMMFEPFVINTRKDWFRLVTHGFIHGNIPHLAVNMFVLFMFGQNVEHGYAAITGRDSMLPFLILYLAGIKLIDLAGCRGLTRGGAQVSEKHCNFLINTGTATATDIEALGEDVRARVAARFGVTLRWEIKRIGLASDSESGSGS